MQNHRQNGFLMPTVIIMFAVCTVIMVALFQYVAAVANLGSQVIYKQVALTAARGALDYGKEQFDSNANYTGTPETQMFSNSTYRVTYQLQQGSLSDDGRSMRVQGIGRVYVPATASTASYSRTINGEIIRSQIVSKDPSDFSPLAWYDASCNAATSSDPDCQNDTVLKNGTDSAAANPTSMREEKPDGTYCQGAPNIFFPFSDLALSLTSISECGSGQQNVGLMFNLGNKLPKGATVTNAYVQFTSWLPSSADIKITVKGIAADNYPNFTTASGSQLASAPTTTANTTWHVGPWVTPLQTSKTQRTVDISPIIQEIINRPGWQQGNNVGLEFQYQSGPGTRWASQIFAPTLNITFSGYTAANTSGDQVQVWRDRSGNGFHLTSQGAASSWPTKSAIALTPSTATPNGKPTVSFKSGLSSMLANVAASTGRTANTYTAFAVMKVRNGTEKSTGNGYLVGFYGSGTGSTIYAPFWRHPGNNFHTWDPTTGANTNSLCAARGTTESICQTYSLGGPGSSGAIDNNPSWTIFSDREALTERDEIMRRNGNGTGAVQQQFETPITLNAPYSIVLGANPKTLTPNADVDYAEVILYDRMLTCDQTESVEQYLAQKWGFTDTTLPSGTRYQSSGCAENPIPIY